MLNIQKRCAPREKFDAELVDRIEKTEYRLLHRQADEIRLVETRFESSSNWSGAYITANHNRRFLQIWGTWTIPALNDWDATVVSLFDIGLRKYVATAGKEGILHVLDRETGDTFTEDIGDDNPVALYVPGRHAHGFEALTDLMFVYHVTEEYDPADPDEHGIAWDDPRVAELWSQRSPILSPRDTDAAS
jgi:hypothetical protein